MTNKNRSSFPTRVSQFSTKFVNSKPQDHQADDHPPLNEHALNTTTIDPNDTEESLKYIFNNLNAGIWMWDANDEKITFASKGLEKILQLPLAQLYGEPYFWEDLIHADDVNRAVQAHLSLQKGKQINVEYRIKAKDGETKWIREESFPRMDGHGEIINFYGVITDVTDEVRLQEELNFFASHDTLTELPNQRSLYKRLDQLCENKRNRFAVLYLDLDRIDVINDSLGHEIGNELIKKVVERLTSTLPEDTYIARLNNNDFVLLIDYVRKEDIFDLAEKVIATLEKKMTIKEYELFPMSSIGISFFPSDGDEKLPLIRNAHAALYHAKKQGKNNYQLYSYSKDIYSYKQYELELDMRHAIENEEFEIYYQPQVDTYTGVLEGAEALLRWNHRNWGLVSPGEFIPLAEENHYIHEIGE